MIKSHKHPACITIRPPFGAEARSFAVMSILLLLLLFSPIHAHAENEGGDAPPQSESSLKEAPAKATSDDAAHQARIAARRAANKNNKPRSAEVEPTPTSRQPIELMALRDEPAPVKTDWQASLGTTLAGLGIAGFWSGMGLNMPIAQLSVSLALLMFLVFGSKMLIDRFSRRIPTRGKGSVKYIDDSPNSTMMNDDKPGSRHAVPKQTEKPVPLAGRTEPSLQAPTRPVSAPAVRSSNTVGGTHSRFADTNFAPTSSQQMAARQQVLANAAVSPSERAGKAAVAAGAAAKAVVNGATNSAPQEDYGSIPANFNVAGFIRKTRLYFIRLQIAWDKSDLQNISEITTADICEEFRRQVIARGPSDNVTEVLAFEADVLGVKAVGQQYVVTVKMTGIVKESESNMQEAFEEIWRLSRSMTGKENWLLADIKQY